MQSHLMLGTVSRIYLKVSSWTRSRKEQPGKLDVQRMTALRVAQSATLAVAFYRTKECVSTEMLMGSNDGRNHHMMYYVKDMLLGQ